MAIIFGTKESGKSGQLDHDELTALIQKKSGDRASEKNCAVCATHIENMSSTAGQGGITTKFAGRSVFHISSGKKGNNDGCSVFFTLSAQGAQPGQVLVAGIVAVGSHSGATSNVYRLDWGKGPPFFTGNLLDTSTQHQPG